MKIDLIILLVLYLKTAHIFSLVLCICYYSVRSKVCILYCERNYSLTLPFISSGVFSPVVETLTWPSHLDAM